MFVYVRHREKCQFLVVAITHPQFSRVRVCYTSTSKHASSLTKNGFVSVSVVHDSAFAIAFLYNLLQCSIALRIVYGRKE